MRNEEFMEIVHKRVAYCMQLISIKRAEYSPGTEVKDERLQNFKDTAAMNGTNFTQALWGMMCKQVVSVKDMLLGNETFTEAYIAEKLGDVIIYSLLAEGCLREEGRVSNGPVSMRRQMQLMEMMGIDVIAYGNFLAHAEALKSKIVTEGTNVTMVRDAVEQEDYKGITDVLNEYYGFREGGCK